MVEYVHRHIVELECGHWFSESMMANIALDVHKQGMRRCSDMTCGSNGNDRRVIQIRECKESVIEPPKMHTPIPVLGYRELTQVEIDAMNNLKRSEEWIKKQWFEYSMLIGGDISSPEVEALLSAKECFKEGFMWMTRAVARPTNDW